VYPVLVELVEDLPQGLLVVGFHRHPAERLGLLVRAHVEHFHVEVAPEVHHRAEALLHRPRVDDVAFEFDRSSDSHTTDNGAGSH